jgi:hypothetical protein
MDYSRTRRSTTETHCILALVVGAVVSLGATAQAQSAPQASATAMPAASAASPRASTSGTPGPLAARYPDSSGGPETAARTPTGSLASRPPAVDGADAPSGTITFTARYGGQILLGDTPGFALGLAALATSNATLGKLALPGYLLISPIIHLAQRSSNSVGNAFISLGLRVSLPIMGLAAGYFAACPATGADGEPTERPHCERGIAIGGVAGLLGAVVLDAAFLAKKIERAEEAQGPRFLPLVAVDQHGGTLGLGGTW